MRRYVRPVTPAEVSGHLAALCSELAPNVEPIYIDVLPDKDAPPNECFPLVASKVRAEGGECVVGWSLWELPTLFVEAEFHAVWRSPSAQFLDITPKTSPCEKILFLADPVRQYDGRQVNNVRKAISYDPVVLEYLRTFDQRFELMNRGERANMHGKVEFEGDEALEYQRLNARLCNLQQMIHSLCPEIGPYSPCWCGSGKRSKWCHRV